MNNYNNKETKNIKNNCFKFDVKKKSISDSNIKMETKTTNKMSMISHNIKKRKHPNDVFITPVELAKKLIKFHNNNDDELIWLDPFKNNGSFYNNFPDENPKDWCEILLGMDFFKYEHKVDIISSNPPYSMLDDVLEKTYQICRKEFGYLIGMRNLTTRRIEIANKNGFFIKSMFITKVFRFYGMSVYVVFSKEINVNLVQFDRTVWKENGKNKWDKKKNNK